MLGHVFFLEYHSSREFQTRNIHIVSSGVANHPLAILSICVY